MKQPTIAIVDYGLGNVTSVCTALQDLGYRKTEITSSPTRLRGADIAVLPGVGAFSSCLQSLVRAGLSDALQTFVIENHKPILGICVGMQLMGTSSTELGTHAGLGWLNGRVDKITPSGGLPVPHVGWNEVTTTSEAQPLQSVFDRRHFYFDHSFAYLRETDSSVAVADYGGPICAMIAHENILGVQFHPERSQVNGLKFFRRFVEWAISC